MKSVRVLLFCYILKRTTTSYCADKGIYASVWTTFNWLNVKYLFTKDFNYRI